MASLVRAALAATLLVAIGMVASCGQKGPLYLPEEPEEEDEAASASGARRDHPDASGVPLPRQG